jgi:hypothetical protein
MQCIALCIPFDIGDLDFLQQSIQSIEQQTVQPDIVVYSFSRCPKEQQTKIQDILDNVLGPCQVCAAFSEDIQLPGENRNVAAELAQKHGAELLSFIDADDVMHPRRIECIVKVFKEDPSTNLLVHSCIRVPKIPLKDVTTIQWPELREKKYMDCVRAVQSKRRPWRLEINPMLVEDDPTAGILQNGHVSLPVAVWQEYPYLEYVASGEDSHFNATICERTGRVTILSDALSAYFVQDHPGSADSVPSTF